MQHNALKVEQVEIEWRRPGKTLAELRTLRPLVSSAYNAEGLGLLEKAEAIGPIAQERVVPQKSALVAITLKRAYADGTVAVEMDPLSLLCRLAMMVPPPRHHTVKYAGVLAAASKLRARIAPSPALATDAAEPRPTERRAATGRGHC